MNSQFRVMVLAMVVAAFGLGVWFGTLLTRDGGVTPGAPQANATMTTVSGTLNIDLINAAWQKIQANYVDRPAIKGTDLTYGAISGMVDALGDTGHSRFETPAMIKQQQQQLSGSYEGVGVDVQKKNGQVVVVAPIDNSPAQRAGIKPGDIIMKVNGQTLDDLDLSAVAALILGPAGSKVHLTIQEAGTTNVRELDLTRQKITVDPVTWQQIPGTNLAHVRLSTFSKNLDDQLKSSLKAIKDQKLDGIVLDLRNNPGGLLNQAVAASSEFISSGNVLLVRDAQGKDQPVPVNPGGAATDLPLVVLINGGSASSSEIMAGAMQDHQRGKLVGETTFGTGTVLSSFDLPDGSALLLAIQEWLTPNGKSFWHKGLAPDVHVTMAPDVAPLYPSAERSMSAAQLAASGDVQLLKAIDLLKQAGAK